MKYPLHVVTGMVERGIKNTLRGRKRQPMVLMLEPLYACNLACVGCALERHTGKLKDRLPVATCLKAVDDCGALMVSICGGEPTMYPELRELVDGVIARKRHVILCTNALLPDNIFDKLPPHSRLTVNVHLDGMKKTHDFVCNRDGVFDKAVSTIKEAKKRGYRVMTNTTVFKETDMDEVEKLCELLSQIGVDGMLVAPGYQYESLQRDVCLTRDETRKKFTRVLELSKRFPLSSTPMFLEFAAGLRDYHCSPWSTVTYTPRGWKRPCYLIGEDYLDSWDEFWNGTDWDYWESRQDRRCQNCAMHSGFEASAVADLAKHPRDMLRMVKWQFAS